MNGGKKTAGQSKEENSRGFLPDVDAFFEKAGCGGMMTIERAEVIRYSPGKK